MQKTVKERFLDYFKKIERKVKDSAIKFTCIETKQRLKEIEKDLKTLTKIKKDIEKDPEKEALLEEIKILIKNKKEKTVELRNLLKELKCK